MDDASLSRAQQHHRYNFGPFHRCRASLSFRSPATAESGRVRLEPVCNFDEFSSSYCKTRPNAPFAPAAALMLPSDKEKVET